MTRAQPTVPARRTTHSCAALVSLPRYSFHQWVQLCIATDTASASGFWAAPASPLLWLPFSLLGSPSCALPWDQCLPKARGTAPWSGLGRELLGALVLPPCPRAAALCPVALRNMICFASAGNKLSWELRGALIKLAYAGGPGRVLSSSHSQH